MMRISLQTGFSLFFPCSVWGGRKPTAALSDKARDESSAFRLVVYPIRQADRSTQNKLFFMVFIRINNPLFLFPVQPIEPPRLAHLLDGIAERGAGQGAVVRFKVAFKHVLVFLPYFAQHPAHGLMD